MQIRETSAEDLPAILEIHSAAFGQAEEAELTRDLLADPTAHPLLSLIAEEDDRPLGHVLFTGARLTKPDSDVPVSILAPLAVVPVGRGNSFGHPHAPVVERLERAGVSVLRTDLHGDVIVRARRDGDFRVEGERTGPSPATPYPDFRTGNRPGTERPP